jgi:hypothetical protein
LWDFSEKEVKERILKHRKQTSANGTVQFDFLLSFGFDRKTLRLNFERQTNEDLFHRLSLISE